MTIIDLTEAVEEMALRTRLASRATEGRAWAMLSEDEKAEWRSRVRWQVECVAPVLEAAVRTQVTAELHEGGHHHAAHATRRASFWEGRR